MQHIFKNLRNQAVTDYPLDTIDDDEIAKGLLDAVRKENHAAGIPVMYSEDDTDPNCEWVIMEYPNGQKKRYHVDELGDV